MLRPAVAILLLAVSSAAASAPVSKPSLALAAKAKRIIAERLIDPRSLTVRNTHLAKASIDGQTVTLVCGEYNSKNHMGGYAGFRQFVYEPAVMKGVLSFDDNLSLDFFSATGAGDLSHDPEAAIQAGADPGQLVAAHQKYTDFAEKYLPVCLGAS